MVPIVKCKKKKKPTRTNFQYTEEALANALSDIRAKVRGLNEACRKYGVPRATVQDRIAGRVAEQRRKVGPEPMFGFDGEQKIVEWIIELAKCGIPIDKTDLFETVAQLAKDLGIEKRFPGGKPGVRWYRNFLKRHPNITVREPESINKAREAIKESTIRKWFADLYIFLSERNSLDVLDDPNRILNADETGISLCPKSGKVIAPKGFKNVYVVKKGNEKETITVLVVMTASGKICPPLVVFPYIRPPKAVIDSVPAEWIVGKTESGWMRADVFCEYISNGFNDWLTKENVKRPVLFFVDGHKSHMSIPLSKFCDDNGIILYALPPNTTHILQPADVSVFRPLKQEWKNTVKKWQSRPENLNKCVTKTNFCKVFKETLDDMEMTDTIKNGFRRCGLYPFDVEQVDFTKCVKDAQIRNATAAQTNSGKPLTERHFQIAKQVFALIEKNIAKQGIDPRIILNEIDHTKNIYLQKRRSKSKTPRNSNSTPRHSKSPRNSKSSDVNKSSETTSKCTRAKTSGKRTDAPFVINDSDCDSIQIPDIGSLVSLDDISVIPMSDIDLSEISQSITIPGDYIAVSDDISAESFLRGGTEMNTVKSVQDIVITEAPEKEKTKRLNTVDPMVANEYRKLSGSPDSTLAQDVVTTEASNNDKKEQHDAVDIVVAKEYIKLSGSTDSPLIQGVTTEASQNNTNKQLNTIDPVVVNENKESSGNTNTPLVQDDVTTDTRQNNKNKQLNDVDPLGINEKIVSSGSTDTPLIQDVVTTEPPHNDKNKELNAMASVEINENIEYSGITDNPFKEFKKPLSKNVENSLLEIDPFRKHLKFPTIADKKQKPSSNKLPSAISSKAWREYYELKEKEKKEKEEQKNKRKLDRDIKKRQKETPKKKRRLYKKKSSKEKQIQQSCSRIKCSSCEEDLFSDTEEEGEKNIGCDDCIRWYHLKCTKLNQLSFAEAATINYICELCQIAQVAREDVLREISINMNI